MLVVIATSWGALDLESKTDFGKIKLMSHSLGGSVLAEQTVLEFTPNPPSSGCSSLLPSAVCEGRGGETRFAMNHQTQLQFNLGVAPDQAKLATSFNPSHPSPVTIHKPETIGLSQTPVQEFKAVSTTKLALAMKMAKRYARINSAPDLRDKKVCHHDGEDDSEDSDDEEFEHEPHYLRQEETSKDPPHGDVRGSLLREYARSVPESIGKELGQLQLELDKRIEKLHNTEGKKPAVRKPGVKTVGGAGVKMVARSRGVGRVSGRVVNDRICWDNLDETEEREQQRRGEQWARNTRLMYDLSQQVKGLQKHMHKKKPQNTQSVIVQKLAAAQRAALRTLQGFSQYGRALLPIPPELTFLIQQLGLLSSQLGGGVNTEMSDDLQQLMVTIDNQAPVKHFRPETSVPLQPAGGGTPLQPTGGNRYSLVKKKKRKQGGVLFTSPRHQRSFIHGDHTHFTDSTFNSARRQQPLLPYTPCQDCPPEVRRHARCHGTPQFSHVHLSPADFKSTPRKKVTKVRPQSSPGRTKTPLAIHSSKPARKKKKVSHQQKKSKSGDSKEDDHITDLVDRLCSEDEPGMSAAELSSAIASQANQLKALRQEISQKLVDLKSGRDRGEAERSAQLATNVSTMDDYVPPYVSPPNFTDSRLPSMLKRLEELEVEEDAIRQRWNTIAYEDPLVTRPAAVVPQRGGAQGGKDVTTAVPTSCRHLEEGASLPVLSSGSLSSIQQYRERYMHHLNTAGQSTLGGGTDPWKMAESIADDILGETLEGVASEMELLCNHCVEELYNHEFIRPP